MIICLLPLSIYCDDGVFASSFFSVSNSVLPIYRSCGDNYPLVLQMRALSHLSSQLPPLPNSPNSMDKQAIKATAKARALTMIRSNRYTFRVIAMRTGLSYGTVSNLATGKSVPSISAGHPTMLPPEVEAVLVKKLLMLAQNGCSIEVCKLPIVVVGIARSLKLDLGNFVGGSKWLMSFLARHPELSKRTPSKTNQARCTHFNRISVAQWFAAFGALICKYEPEELWNMDDTSFDLEMIYNKVRGGRRGLICVKIRVMT